MSPDTRNRLRAALVGTPLAERFEVQAADFLRRWNRDPALGIPSEAVAQGLARVLASSLEAARLLSHRSSLVPRIGQLDPGFLVRRGEELARSTPHSDPEDLEGFLDEIRLLRREETVLTACLDLGGMVPFEEVSAFLSLLAETILGWTLPRARVRPDLDLSVVAMGKLGSREFTYTSDLDLIFLFGGSPEQVDPISRTGQRLISYLATATGAGIAYAVDARLRPSGHQGTLVTSFAAFERYQCETAQIWEHLALSRARAVAGDVKRAQALLDGVRQRVQARASAPWSYVAELRRRVERERAHEEKGAIAFKTGSGGIMDVEFLAAGGLLERGARRGPPPGPGIPMLLAHVAQGARVEALLGHYRFLRRVEARARWVRGAPVEQLPARGPELPVIAELVETGMPAEQLLDRVRSARNAVREDIDAVIAADSIAALEA